MLDNGDKKGKNYENRSFRATENEEMPEIIGFG